MEKESSTRREFIKNSALYNATKYLDNKFEI
ncbi:MAG: hypothetical protein PWQ42_477 [Sulfurospirillum sp.]|jgi:hypothetical protein|nr:hypothetical protein [Sulfurospirillum sp.]